MKRILVSATNSGAGKTTICLGLMRAFYQRGLTVQPYKVGPDYIDTLWHEDASHKASCNLDAYILPESTLKSIFYEKSQKSEINIVEGVMGLYDGYGSDPDYCSSAALAKSLDLPVILVVDGKAVSTSIAATVLGFQKFDPSINIAGVIINRVNSESHYELLKTAIESCCGIPVLGRLPNADELVLPSRHLGLYLKDEIKNIDQYWAKLCELVETYIDLDRILEMSESSSQEQPPKYAPIDYERNAFDVTIAIAKDAAFQFYYPENLSLLMEMGAKLVPFSPLNDATLPPCDAVFIGSGYPERFAKSLSDNQSMRASILSAHSEGKPIYAECGGMLYLGNSLMTEEGNEYEMVGILEGKGRITHRLQQFGYCEGKSLTDTLFVKRGETIRGHEFHYSIFETELPPCFELKKIKDGVVSKSWQGGHQVENTFASHVRLHFYQHPEMAVNFLKKAAPQ